MAYLLKTYLTSRVLFLIPILLHISFLNADFPQLHRALPGSNGKPGYRVLSTTVSVASRSQDKQQHVADKESLQNRQTIMDFESNWTYAVVYSLISAVLVGLSGIFPLLVIPLEAGPSLKDGAGSALLKLLLSFAVGSLLGDVFLHLLPESWATVNSAVDPHWEHTVIGLWVIGGILSFMIIEKLFMDEEDEEENRDVVCEKKEHKVEPQDKLSNGHTHNGLQNGFGIGNGVRSRKHSEIPSNSVLNGEISSDAKEEEQNEGSSNREAAEPIKISGYLNLLANFIDNFTHGLAVAGSYLISPKVGVCTTIAILLHEIPHEVGDFAILLRSGFNRWKAAKAQVLTASGGVLGALFALYSDSAESAGDKTAAILPFTAGGFIYIALVTVVPDLLKEKSPLESIKQVCCMIGGIISMVLVTILFE